MPSRPSPAPATWAVVLSLLTVGCGSTVSSSGSSGKNCDTQSLPIGDPCRGKSCCDSVNVLPDGGAAGPDAGAGTVTRICGACNG